MWMIPCPNNPSQNDTTKGISNINLLLINIYGLPKVYMYKIIYKKKNNCYNLISIIANL